MLENKQVSWRELLDILKRRWLIEVLVMVVILVAGIFSLNLRRPTAVSPAKYQASSQVLLTLQTDKRQVVMDQMPNPQYVKTFAEVARTNLVAKPVRKKLAKQSVTLSLHDLKKQVTVYTNDNNSLLDIEVASNNRTDVKKIARTYAKVVSQKVSSVMGIGRGRVVEISRVKKNLVSQKLSFKRVLGLIFVAIILGGATGFLVEYFDQRIRSHYFVATFFGTEPLQLSATPTATELATVRNTLDIKQASQHVIALQAPAATKELRLFGQQLAEQYAKTLPQVLVVDLATDTATLQAIANETRKPAYQAGPVAKLEQGQAPADEPPQLTLQQLAKCLTIFEKNFPLVILLAAGVQLVGNVQLASHLADSRLLLLQQGRSNKKAALQLQRQAHNRTPFTAVLYLKA